MDERSRKIAQGLAAAEKGEQALTRRAARRMTSSARPASARRRSSTTRSSAPTRWSRRPRARRTRKARAWWQPRTSRSSWRPPARARACARKWPASPWAPPRSCWSARSTRNTHAELLEQARDADLGRATWLTRLTIARPYAKRGLRGGAEPTAGWAPGPRRCTRRRGGGRSARANLLGNPHVTPDAAVAAGASDIAGAGPRRAWRQLRAARWPNAPPGLPAGDRRAVRRAMKDEARRHGRCHGDLGRGAG